MSQKTRVPAAPEAKSSSNSTAAKSEKKEASGGAHILKGRPVGSAAGDSSPNDPGRRFSAGEFRRTSFQAKLRLGSVDDPLEKEADAVADQVVDGKPPVRPMPRANWKVASQTEITAGVKAPAPASTKPAAPVPVASPAPSTAPVPKISRAKKTVEEDPEEVVDADTEQRIAGLSGAGEPLPNRSFFEQRMGRDFSDVRIHRGAEAAELTRRTHARAFTVGKNIVFGPGEFAPASRAGKKLIAHELTHVVQQGASGVSLQRRERPPGSAPGGVQRRGNAGVSTSVSTPASVTPAAGVQSPGGTGRIASGRETADTAGSDSAPVAANATTAPSAENREGENKNDRVPEVGGEPTAILEQLENTSPTGLIGTFARSRTAMDKAMDERIAAEQAAQPVMPTPTGMPSGPRPKRARVSTRRRRTPSSFRSMRSDRNRRRRLSTRVSLPEDGRKTPVKMGPRPKVDRSGAANPRQVANARAESERIVAAERRHARGRTNKDFGEKRVRPAPDKSMVKARRGLQAKIFSPGAGVADPGVPEGMHAKLNESVGPELRKRISEQTEKGKKAESDFQKKRNAAHKSAQDKIKAETTKTRDDQSKAVRAASGEVNSVKRRWRTRIGGIESQYKKDARSTADKQMGRIRDAQRAGEKEADEHFSRAEGQAREEKNSAFAKIKKFGGAVLDFIADTSTFIGKQIKKIFDILRAAVKRIFEFAKRLAVAAIEAARRVVVAVIKEFGELLKQIINVALAAFPRVARFFTGLIDKAVGKAVAAVNKAAALLKKAVVAVLDFLAKAVDLLLAAYQAIYSGLFQLLADLINGKWKEIMMRLGWLGQAAKQMPNHFMGALSEAILGQDITKPLPFERLKPANTEQPSIPGANDANLRTLEQKSNYTADDIKVEPVANLELAPELLRNILRKVVPGGELVFGESTEPWRNVGSLLAEARGGGDGPGDQPANTREPVGGTSTTTTDAPTTDAPGGDPALTDDVDACNVKEKKDQPAKDGQVPRIVGPFESATERLGFMSKMIGKSISEWFECNKVAIIAGSIAAIAAFVALFIITGGAITAAIPPLLKVLAAVMLGVAMVQIGRKIGDYLKLGWEGKIEPAAKALALALALGAFELLSAVLFNVGRIFRIAKRVGKVTAKRGLRAGLKQAGTAARSSARRQVRETRRGFARAGQKFARSPLARASRAAIRNGKIVFPGLKRGALRNVRTLRVMGQRLLRRFRFRKFRIRRVGFRFFIDGFINPWVVLATGEIRKIEKLPSGAQTGGRINIDGKPAFIINRGDEISITPGMKFIMSNPTFRRRLKPPQLATLDRLLKLDKIPKADVDKALLILQQQKAALKAAREAAEKAKAARQADAGKQADAPGATKSSVRSEVDDLEAKRALDELVRQVKGTDAKTQMRQLGEQIGDVQTGILWSWYKRAVKDGLRRKAPWKDLLPEEIIAIRAWTGKNFDDLQAALRSGQPVEMNKFGAWIRFVISGLEKIQPPSPVQPVFRIIDETLMKDPAFIKLINTMDKGSKFVERGISGAHTSVRDGVSVRPGRIAFQITHKNAKSVRGISQSPKEAEVTFKPGSAFRVTEPPIERPLWPGGPVFKVFIMEEI